MNACVCVGRLAKNKKNTMVDASYAVLFYLVKMRHLPCWLLVYYIVIEDDDGYLLTLRDTLSIEEVRCRNPRFPRIALRLPHLSPFEYTYNSGDDQSLITLTGFNYATMALLEAMFTPVFEQYTPHGAAVGSSWLITPLDLTEHGRTQTVTAQQCLAVTLAYYQFTGPMYCMQVCFRMLRQIWASGFGLVRKF
jgi:hypothetical protein